MCRRDCSSRAAHSCRPRAAPPSTSGADGETRTPTGYPTAPSRQRVYQFHHVGGFHIRPAAAPPCRRRLISVLRPISIRRGALRRGLRGLAGPARPELPARRRPSARASRRSPCCITPCAAACVVANQVRPRLVAKNTAARTAVVRDRKLADPAAPKTEPDDPLPNAAPMSAPLPCCSSTNPQIADRDQQGAAPITTFPACSFVTPAPRRHRGRSDRSGTRNRQKFPGLERRAADQAAVDVRHPEQRSRVVRLSRCRRTAAARPPRRPWRGARASVACTACASAGVAVRPVPIAQTGS